MDRKATRGIAQAIQAVVPNLHCRGPLLAATPRGRILRGLCLDRSSNREWCYLWAFVQPLYAPANHIHFALGKRLGGMNKAWRVTETTAMAQTANDEGRPFYEPINTAQALADWPRIQDDPDPYVAEAIGLSLIAAGRPREGARILRASGQSLQPLDPQDWAVELKERLLTMADLADKNPHQALAQLDQWQEETIAALGVHDIP